MSETGSQTFARLLNLRNSAGGLLYQHIALADQLLKDHGWVAATDGGGGDESKALTRLEQECFGDLCGAVSLPQLLDLYRHVPNIVTWRQAKFNPRQALGRTARQAETRTAPISWETGNNRTRLRIAIAVRGTHTVQGQV